MVLDRSHNFSDFFASKKKFNFRSKIRVWVLWFPAVLWSSMKDAGVTDVWFCFGLELFVLSFLLLHCLESA